MGSLHDKIIRALKNGFRDLVDGLETVNSAGRVSGFVVSPDFENKDDGARQDRLWHVLDQHLDDETKRQVGPIVALTPAEAEIDISLDE